MNTLIVKTLASLFLIFNLNLAASAFAVTTQECTKELLLSYFPEPFVRETLDEYHIPKDKHDAIVQDLQGKDRTVIEMVEAKAEEMNPNPLKSPGNRMEAIRIFRESLLTVFNQVMETNGITDQEEIQKMLDSIQEKKAKHFAQCMERHHRMMQEKQQNENIHGNPEIPQ